MRPKYRGNNCIKEINKTIRTRVDDRFVHDFQQHPLLRVGAFGQGGRISEEFRVELGEVLHFAGPHDGAVQTWKTRATVRRRNDGRSGKPYPSAIGSVRR